MIRNVLRVEFVGGLDLSLEYKVGVFLDGGDTDDIV